MIGKKQLVVQISATTDIGIKRETNQDNLFVMKNVLDYPQLEHFSSADLCGTPILVAVCDGMGGGLLGERASKLAASSLEYYNLQSLQALKTVELIEVLKNIFMKVNYEIFKEYGVLGTLTGCTMTLLYIDDKRGVVVNVGDSPCIRVDKKSCRMLTRIDNRATLLYEQGQISEKERWTHKTKNQLSQYLGIDTQNYNLEPHVYIEKHVKRDVSYLLCSDGVTDGVSIDEIHQMLLQEFKPDISKKLVVKAMQNGSKDNITAIAVKIN